MKDIESRITVNDKEYPIVFNLNVMEEIQKRIERLKSGET